MEIMRKRDYHEYYARGLSVICLMEKKKRERATESCSWESSSFTDYLNEHT